MVEIIIQVPEALAAKLEPVRARLPEVLEHGLDELSPLPNQTYHYILDFLVSRPSPEAVVSFGPTPEMQARASALLEKNRASRLTPLETEELDEYVRIDQLITLFKARALPFLDATA